MGERFDRAAAVYDMLQTLAYERHRLLSGIRVVLPHAPGQIQQRLFGSFVIHRLGRAGQAHLAQRHI